MCFSIKLVLGQNVNLFTAPPKAVDDFIPTTANTLKNCQ